MFAKGQCCTLNIPPKANKKTTSVMRLVSVFCVFEMDSCLIPIRAERMAPISMSGKLLTMSMAAPAKWSILKIHPVTSRKEENANR